ncbi:hypothetical protein Semix9P1_phi47 [Clostridioides phage phiSemix9P1]|uniref:hypothetical protein n=1 Tax=unclassified Clostridioides TaxID=2635829 RepID=UPI0009C38378|nr:hypothetical protein Semix9P1_phi47 [Clostridioides phage phiSemix9P1]MCC0642161.1 hypothetical protein [Clostridioides sp. ES-S-0049-03]MCC0646142.1 hypothetical protein [Clostridioides sp. ZZV14-6150]MCC0678149.1 hypothetical protein [Clostridioides sp. ES-W-0018-02]MCC0712947.1 hypothetical protein [Clostridioides sp. ES-W-0017-02]MCC0718348.1 hypothetical protein [Clostridioides sp. ZZV14-6105]MCC0723961.1 hypothetical protein [Clostridioides sp. ZZV14-6104]MCC0724835.1 hypothetical p
MKKNTLKIVNGCMYIVAIILLLLIWLVGIKNISIQPILTTLVKVYICFAFVIIAINLLKYFQKK